MALARRPSDDIERPARSGARLASCARKDRLLEIIHDFMVFDAGVKKTCRHNQYFGVKAAQERVRKREGGIIWHTQGSGKSLTMVWLAKWIREHQPDARVLLITDRTELDEQIESVFNGRQRERSTARPAAPTCSTLSTSRTEWLICSLIHKFRGSDSDSDDDAGRQRVHPRAARRSPEGLRAKGNLFVFVDEAHRTQSGKMHDAMKELLPGAMFIGFTGTPLLKADKEHQHRDSSAPSSTPTSSTRPSRTASCSTCATRPATSTST